MKKYISILLAFAMLLCFCACDVSIEKKDGHIDPETFDINEAIEYISGQEPEKISVKDTGLLAPARDSESGQYGFINVLGEWVIEPKYAAAVAFKGDYGLILNSYSGYEYIDRNGRKVYSTYGKNQIAESNHFSDGLLNLSLANDALQRYVYLDINFLTAINANGLPAVDWRWYANYGFFGLATPFNNGYAVVMRQKNANCHDWLDAESAYIIDKSGAIVATLPAGLDADLSGVDENGNVIVKTNDNLYGLCGMDGKVRIEVKYRFLRHNEGKLYLACNDKGFWGYLDENGETVIPFQYQKALPFTEGLAAVFDGRYWGFIDETGALRIESVFDDVIPMKASNVDVSGNKGAFCEGRAAVKKEDYWIIIDQNEYPYICMTKEKCEGIDGCPFICISNGYISYKQNVDGNILCGVMTLSGKRVIEPKFEYIDAFN
ncbi:MAG: WG repeat-containing protein [Firmicutes bacterium]|nr:WG repeat-containing protein [Bacillota bacterium]